MNIFSATNECGAGATCHVAARTQAIRKIIQVRSLFLDEASIRYTFQDDSHR